LSVSARLTLGAVSTSVFRAGKRKFKIYKMEKQIKLAAKLYQCRDTAKRFYREEFTSKIEPYKDLIKRHMELKQLDELKSAMEICEIPELKGNGGFTIIMILAAAVELMEPSASAKTEC
jgi:hypothetical protein